MRIFPAIDLIDGKAVRLYKGDYSKMTVYSDNPPAMAEKFSGSGAEYIHIVDLDGAKRGDTSNYPTVCEIIRKSGLKAEIGGGIRTEETIKKYIDAGVMRVILGTAALTEPGFVGEMVAKYGEKIAVGVDIRNGFVAIKGWTETSETSCFDFCQKLQNDGVKSVICTDISKDGAMSGTNTGLYRDLTHRFSMGFVASGGVSSMEDVKTLSTMNLEGAILGKALYTGDINLKEALEAAGSQD